MWWTNTCNYNVCLVWTSTIPSLCRPCGRPKPHQKPSPVGAGEIFERRRLRRSRRSNRTCCAGTKLKYHPNIVGMCIYVYVYIYIITHTRIHTHTYIYIHRLCAYVVVIDTPRKGNSVNAGNKWIKGYCTLNFNESCWNYWSKLGLLKSGTPASVGMQHPKNSKTVIETAESWNMSNLVHIHQYGSIHLHPIDPIVIHCMIIY